MKTYIILLRGINVSGQKKIKMADLRELLNSNGFKDVETYIQSGNIILRSALAHGSIVLKIQELILNKYGFEVNPLVLDQKELESVCTTNPFRINQDVDISKLHVTLLKELPKDENLNVILGFKDAGNQFKVKGKTIYLYCPDGYGKVKINNNFFEKKLKVEATTRNWKTMNILLNMCQNKTEKNHI